MADEFLVRVVLEAGHAVGDDRRQQRFDRAQHRDRDRGADQCNDLDERHLGRLEPRQPERDAAELAPERCDAPEMKDRLQYRGHDHRDQRPRDALQTLDARREQHERQTQRGQRNGRQVALRQNLDQVPQLFVEMHPARLRQAEKVAPLTHEDDDADARGETDDDRGRDELDDRAQARQAHQYQDRTRHERGDLQAGDAVLRGDARQDGDEGACRAGDLHAGAAEQRDGDTAHDGGVEPLLRARARRDREGHRQRKRDDADDHAGRDVAAPRTA